MAPQGPPATTEQVAKYGKVSQDRKSHTLTKTEWAKINQLFKLKDKLYDQLSKSHDKLKDDKADLEETVKEQTDVIVDLTDRIDKLKSGKNGKKKAFTRKDEQKKDVCKAIQEFVRLVLFRNIKFALPGTGLKKACSIVWAGIKDEIKLESGPTPLDLANFTEIYDSWVLEKLSDQRAYNQGRCSDPAKGKSILSNFTLHLVMNSLITSVFRVVFQSQRDFAGGCRDRKDLGLPRSTRRWRNR